MLTTKQNEEKLCLDLLNFHSQTLNKKTTVMLTVSMSTKDIELSKDKFCCLSNNCHYTISLIRTKYFLNNLKVN